MRIFVLFNFIIRPFCHESRDLELENTYFGMIILDINREAGPAAQGGNFVNLKQHIITSYTKEVRMKGISAQDCQTRKDARRRERP
jgi:hypothetical protein